MIIANFINKQDALVTGLDQYDYGQVLRIQGLKLPTAVEIHFGLEETGGTTVTRIGVTKDGVTDVVIPDSMLENGDTSLDYTIYAFIYLTDETSGKTTNRIKIQVKARSKPELLNKPEDKELFQKAIEAVNQSAKEAEGWAHGREDMPERATDNAKYYSEQASGSAEEVKKVEQSVKDMVATVDGIEQQVQDVKEYAGQAKTAAENALLSEQEAKKSEEASLQHRTGAETAENNAELAESNAKKSEQAVEQAKQLVMQMGQEVLQNKNQVDEKVEAFNKVVTDAVDAVGAVKTDAVNTIGTKGTEQTKKVTDEGAKQVKAVEGKGQEVLQSIPEDFTTQMESKLDKQQGSENKGKALVVGDDGNVTVGEVQGGDGIPIINTMSDMSPLVVPDSAERVNKGFSLIGKSEQITTTGAQLFDWKPYLTTVGSKEQFKEKLLEGYTVLRGIAVSTSVIQYGMGNQVVMCMKAKSDTQYFFGGYKKSNIVFLNDSLDVVGNSAGATFLTTADTAYIVMYIFNYAQGPSAQIYILSEIKEMNIIGYGEVVKPYEPYTGGKPSPSPEYPQEIKSVGKWNEETGKYDIEVSVSDEAEAGKKQTITLSLDRPLRGTGVYNDTVTKDGIVRKICEPFELDLNTVRNGGYHKKNTYHFSIRVDKKTVTYSNDKAIFCNMFDDTATKNTNVYNYDGECIAVGKEEINFRILKSRLKDITTFEKAKESLLEYMADKKMIVQYATAEEAMEPFPEDFKQSLESLKTYYPTTVITTDGGEVDPDVEVTYIADTKNYIDQKIAAIGKTVVETQKALL